MASLDAEQVQPLVIENGSFLFKAGFAGDDAIRAVFPPVYGQVCSSSAIPKMNEKPWRVADEALSQASRLRLYNVIERGKVLDWFHLECLWRHTFETELRVVPEEQPVLLIESPHTSNADRERKTQIMFETFNIPNLYLENSAVLALTASRRTTGLVLDVGHGVSHAVPVVEGRALPHAIRQMDFAGSDLNEYLRRLLTEAGYSLTAEKDNEVVRDMKEKVCSVALDLEEEIQNKKKSEFRWLSYEHADGRVFGVGIDAFVRTGEALFRPQILQPEAKGLHELTYDAIMKCDADIQQKLFGNIFLCGGTSMMNGISERLQRELALLSPSTNNIEIFAPPERKFSPWIGGSMMASSSSFKESCVSKQEYEESGPSIVHKKCL